MMNNGLMFGGEGPVMEGYWFNPQTGDSFTVRNSFFEDNQYIVQTTDGRILNYNQVQNYIKSDKPVDTAKIIQQNQQPNLLLPQEVANLIDDSSDAPVSLGNLSDSYYNYIDDSVTHTDPIWEEPKEEKVSMNMSIIDKALSKRPVPKIHVGIDWDDCPIKEMKMLLELMDVEVDEIIDWYMGQVDVESTVNTMKGIIKDHITNQLTPKKKVIEKQDEPAIVEKKTKKTNKKK